MPVFICNKRRMGEGIILILALLLIAYLLISFFEYVPSQTGWPIDWPAFWNAIYQGDLRYAQVDGLRPPPWSMLPLLPLGFVSMRTGWALLTLISLVSLILSVPRYRYQWLGILLLVASFPAVRVVVDGNFEALIVAGVALIVYGFREQRPFLLAMGVLLATFKPQAVFLLLLVLGIALIYKWKWPEILKCIGFTALIVIPSMLWRGHDWLLAVFGQNFDRYTGTLIDVTLVSSLRRLGFESPVLLMAVWLVFVGLTVYAVFGQGALRFNRYTAGFLSAASLLAAPYAAGNSLLVPYAIGIIPFLFVQPRWGIFLVLCVNFSFVINRGENIGWLAYYNTVLLLLFWATLFWQMRKEQSQPVLKAATAPPVMH